MVVNHVLYNYEFFKIVCVWQFLEYTTAICTRVVVSFPDLLEGLEQGYASN